MVGKLKHESIKRVKCLWDQIKPGNSRIHFDINFKNKILNLEILKHESFNILKFNIHICGDWALIDIWLCLHKQVLNDNQSSIVFSRL